MFFDFFIGKPMDHVHEYFAEVGKIVEYLDKNKINEFVEELLKLRVREGRLFLIGLGGSAANCSHIANDFRKCGNLECYCPTDNIAEITARMNDEGSETIFDEWLRTSKLSDNDMLLILSVSGGRQNQSESIIRAINYAKNCGTKILGITGRKDGYLYKKGDLVIITPIRVFGERIVPQTEGLMMLISHCITCHPLFKCQPFSS